MCELEDLRKEIILVEARLKIAEVTKVRKLYYIVLLYCIRTNTNIFVGFLSSVFYRVIMDCESRLNCVILQTKKFVLNF